MPTKRQRTTGTPAADSLVPQYPIESVDNALKLLLLLGERPEIRLSEATRYLGVASSTAHRLLAMLTYRGFVRRDAPGAPAIRGYVGSGCVPQRVQTEADQVVKITDAELEELGEKMAARMGQYRGSALYKLRTKGRAALVRSL
ncbi:helix-turn-helix domain-containing protein [Mycobacterium ostraviense]|uniref:helix-turn-helix domain-containing protein n=1 Tax=Mycobacterium ostraviense TaxID=2738409 RepID=UPI00094CBC10|nr:helix-turn-helix domain-containing protein [Mycobacterium ostraviense]